MRTPESTIWTLPHTEWNYPRNKKRTLDAQVPTRPAPENRAVTDKPICRSSPPLRHFIALSLLASSTRNLSVLGRAISPVPFHTST